MSLYIVATPIGNLKDMTLRGLEVLKSADLIVCEDTRVSLKLLKHYEIEKPLLSIHQHSKIVKLDKVIEELANGQEVALITDAGTPGISDPGNQLVAEAVKNGIQVVPIPGASTVGAMISVAGLNMQKFAFLGFPPHKKGRETFFKEVARYDFPVMYFDSTHRTIKNLELLESLAPGKNVILG
ncbi:MAG: 16S rRNA (cytidine(1402)-2'-O)-methyltransferase, partial [Patescibacteria group bacterium]